jgi:hypothetical protein
MSDMAKKTKKQLSGLVRVDPVDQGEANKIIRDWEAAKTGRISMKDIFRRGLAAIRSELQGA